MNERIKELLIHSEVFNKDGTVLKDVTGYELNKFAELIVRECIETLRLVPYSDSDKEFGDEVIYQDAIRKHFGVEE